MVGQRDPGREEAGSWVRLADAGRWPLLASTVASGLQREAFAAATGLPFGFERVRYEAAALLVPDAEAARLRAVVEREGSASGWLGGYDRRCAAAGDRLFATARSVSRAGAGPHRRDELAEAFAALTGAICGAAPFLATASGVQPTLEAELAAAIGAQGVGGEDVARDLRRSLSASVEPAARRELREFYELTATLLDDSGALAILKTCSPAVAVERLREAAPSLHDRLRAHARAYSWLGTHHRSDHRLDAGRPEELVERMLAVVFRWTPEMAGGAARRKPAPVPGVTLTGPPGVRLTALQELVALPATRIDIFLQATCLAAPLLGALAGALGCPGDHILFSTGSEVSAALAGGNLPLPEIDRRITDSFTLDLAEGELTVRARGATGGTGDPPAEPLTGLTASRGRAVGLVRVVLAAPEAHHLEVGDVLVSGTSSPDVLGGESVFPTRTALPPGIENATAIVTDEGGTLSHAAIVARELGLPCIVGAGRATKVLRDGQVVEVDATTPAGRIIPRS